MEIVVEETLTLAAWRDLVLEKYGGRPALERAAAKPRAHEAQDDLLELQHIESDPAKLRQSSTLKTFTKVRKEDLRKLTPARLSLLERVNREPGAIRVMELAKKARRNEKNVSEDLKILVRLGLLRERKVGREKLIRTRGSDIHIHLLAE